MTNDTIVHEPHRVDFWIDAPEDAARVKLVQARCLRRAARQFREASGLDDSEIVCAVEDVLGFQLATGKPSRLRLTFTFAPSLLQLGKAIALLTGVEQVTPDGQLEGANAVTSKRD